MKMINAERCDQEIYDNGKIVAIICGLSKTELDRLCGELYEISQQPVDWHFYGGRAVIKTLGDVKDVRPYLPTIHIPE